jgi:uroporphyrinogen-III synthase
MPERKRILVTRAKHQASALADALVERGFEVVAIPAIEIVPPEDGYRALDWTLRTVERFEWIIFTSANAVEIFASRLEALDLPIPDTLQVAAIGQATARALSELGLQVDIVPPMAIAESLAEALAPHVADAHVLLVRAAEAREVLVPQFEAVGAKVTVAAAYRTVVPEDSAEALRKELADIDAFTFTSASSVRNLGFLLQSANVTIPKDTVMASIGPVTSQAMRESGWEPTVEAQEASVAALAQALLDYYSNR